MRGLPGSGKTRLLEYLTAISPEAADQEQLSYVAKITSWQRRVRELEEEGWDVRSNIDEPNLAPGTYHMASVVQGPARARQAIRLRYEVLERDQFTCRDCGAVRGTLGVRLEVHHKKMVSQGGDNDPKNLITLCDGCHAGRHAVARGVTRDELKDPSAERRY
jgi:5-methylcytosine-specific restriction endonuclease McrA